MIVPSHALPVVRQCQLLDLSRSSVYYTPQPVSAGDLALMRRIDELHLHHPFAGARMLRDLLGQEGFIVGRRHVATLMQKMGIEALYRRPNTSRKHPQQPVFPYLLRGLEITRANHVWAMDITYIPMRKGFVYLAAVLDWATRRVLSWRLSNTLTTDFCLEAVEESLQRYGTPEIFNTDQGSQFTSSDFVDAATAPWDPAAAWMARAAGSIMSSSSGSGKASSTKKFICMPMIRSLRLNKAWSAISGSITSAVRIPRLTDKPRIRCTSICCHSNRQHKPQDPT